MGVGSSWGPNWSPDGFDLAFYSDRDGATRLWEWERSSGELRRLSDAIARPYLEFETPLWSPDGKQLLAKLLPEGMTIAQVNALGDPIGTDSLRTARDSVPVRVYRSPDDTRGSPETQVSEAAGNDSVSSIYNLSLADVAVIDVLSGAVRRIVRRARVRWYAYSPDGERVAFTTVVGAESSNTQQMIYDLFVVSLRDSSLSARRVARNIRMGSQGMSLAWSPNSDMIAWLTFGPSARGDCWATHVDGGDAVLLTPGSHPSYASEFRTVVWNRDNAGVYLYAGDSVYFALASGRGVRGVAGGQSRELLGVVAGRGVVDGNAFYVATRDREYRVGIARVDGMRHSWNQLIEMRGAFRLAVELGADVSRDGGTVVFTAEDATHPDDIWAVEAPQKSKWRPDSAQRLTHLNVALEGYTYSTPVVLNGGAGGLTLLPTNYRQGVRYPLIVFVYAPIEAMRYRDRFGVWNATVDNLQLFATRGYAVLFPDVRLRVGEPMRAIAESVLPAIDTLVARGIVDSTRVAVIGHSYGGYAATSLLVSSDRFAAAVIRAPGAPDLLSFYGVMRPEGAPSVVGWAEQGQGSMGGSPWEFRDRYLQNSPLLYADRIKTPVLLVQGTADWGVPPHLTDELFIALQRLGKTARYLKYEGGDHWEGSWPLAMQRDYVTRMLDWLAAYLKP